MESLTRIREIFAEAVERAPEERAAFVHQACGDDVALRGAVESLLHAHVQAGDFLKDPQIDPAGFATPGPAAASGQIGPYHILKTLGEGGYATVYLAQQETPVRRQVALKVLKPGLDSRPILSRFAAEREALALMEHPHIARVFDAGETESGHPYFVMEYVDGPPITTFCRTGKMSIPERLALFAEVCMAVQHAHQKGIIHRDLKPANILIAMQDGAPVPKIIDFGIAKSLHGQLTERTLLTGHGQWLGTPQYMSPEQAGAAPDVDTRTDIYALGAILYELLTDMPAFDPAQLRATAGDELQRIIREIDPPWPSTKVLSSTTAAAPEVRAARKTAQLLRGELDWIVIRSMEKDRTRRYKTAESLASDILRHLADEPIEAGPPGRFYRMGKFVRRHRALIATGGAVFLALVAGLAIASVALVHARQERQLAVQAQAAEAGARKQAQEQRAVAEANAARANAEARRLQTTQTFLYRLLTPRRRGNTVEPPPREVLDYAAAKLAEPSLADHPEVLGPVHAALGNGYLEHGLVAEASRQFGASIDACRQTAHGDDPNVASALNNTAATLIMQQKFQEAEPLAREALAMYRRMNHQDDVVDAPVLRNLAAVLANQGKYDEANHLLESALAAFEQAYGHQGGVVAATLDQMAEVLEQQGQHNAATQRRQEAADIRAVPLP